MPGALGTIRAVLRLPSLRRLIPAFLAFSVAEWASWIGVVVYAYSRGGPAEAGIVAGVVFIPSIIAAGDRSLGQPALRSEIEGPEQAFEMVLEMLGAHGTDSRLQGSTRQARIEDVSVR